MAKKPNFCQFIIGWLAKEFFNFEACAHKFSLLKNKTGKSWRTGTCPKCGFKSALVGRSHADKEVHICCCMKCKKHTIARVQPKDTSPTDDAPTNPVDAATQGMQQGVADLKCKATKKDGSPCDYAAKENGYCGVHAGQKVLY